eukprot:CAMPEP_0181314442 /NCGR_PEP_ID=MMETSP1101-20121128/14822_1 /TAXON_ID=46948 /ORGANISM="Rhodomonas abbreviata, Strain Caron Lab Isolate" /LENGTH=366 /DNA_ID=CAMNT_0023421539 /DNA_START=138 /DNA_END=1238 /DNA_ORIENTATION=-
MHTTSVNLSPHLAQHTTKGEAGRYSTHEHNDHHHPMSSGVAHGHQNAHRTTATTRGGKHHSHIERTPWVPPSRWLPSIRSEQQCRTNTLDYRHCLQYDLGLWPTHPLPAHLDSKLRRRMGRLEFTEEMLQTIAQRMSEIPKARIDSTQHTSRRAAVMLPLCTVKGQPSVLLNLRSQNVGTHKGHVCFPGGHLDNTDECMETCAAREVEEELGLRVRAPQKRALWEQEWQKRPYFPKSNILGRLPNCVAVTGTLVTPVVGFFGELDLVNMERQYNRDEIEDVFTMTIEELLNPANITHENVRMGNDMPAFVSGRYRVWGLTAFILHHFLMEVMLPSILTFRINANARASALAAAEGRSQSTSPITFQ